VPVAGLTACVAVAAGGALWTALRWARGRLVLVTVRGQSMMPTYAEGERVLVSRRRRCRTGDVVVFAMPEDQQGDGLQWLVKRVTGTPGGQVPADLPAVVAHDRIPAGFLTVRGDAARSLGSGQLGLVPHASVLGVVIYPARPAPAPPSAPDREFTGEHA
jgi:signal peptidase I